jgi:hypothetical protein
VTYVTRTLLDYTWNNNAISSKNDSYIRLNTSVCTFYLFFSSFFHCIIVVVLNAYKKKPQHLKYIQSLNSVQSERFLVESRSCTVLVANSRHGHETQTSPTCFPFSFGNLSSLFLLLKRQKLVKKLSCLPKRSQQQENIFRRVELEMPRTTLERCRVLAEWKSTKNSVLL